MGNQCACIDRLCSIHVYGESCETYECAIVMPRCAISGWNVCWGASSMVYHGLDRFCTPGRRSVDAPSVFLRSIFSVTWSAPSLHSVFNPARSNHDVYSSDPDLHAIPRIAKTWLLPYAVSVVHIVAPRTDEASTAILTPRSSATSLEVRSWAAGMRFLLSR